MTSLPNIFGYSDLALIGKGGSATVYRARQDQLGRDVAIKVLRSGLVGDRSRQLFDIERLLLGQLSKHPSIVNVFDSGFSADDDPFLVMELCSSGSVAKVVESNGPLAVEQAVRVGTRMAAALHFAHQRDLIHRDVKPENILISDLGEPLLADFGISSVSDADSVTVEGGMSPHHVAPELLRGGRSVPGTDVYSLGSTIFALLVGRNPHQKFPEERLRIEQILARVNDPDFPTDIPRDIDVPSELRLLLRAMMSKDPSRRLNSATQSLEGFRRVETILAMSAKEYPLPVSVDLASMNEVVAEGLRSDSGGVASAVHPEASRSQRNLPTLDPLPGPIAAPLVASPITTPTVVDENSTVAIAASKTKKPAPTPSPVSASRFGSLDKNKAHFLVACALAVVIGGLVAFVLTSSDPKPSDTTVIASETAVGALAGVSPPRNVQLVSRGPTALEVTWIPSNNPGIQYEVEVFRGSSSVTVLPTSGANVTVNNLDLIHWLPCIVVSAVSPNEGRSASASSVCAEVPTDTGGSP